MAYADWLELNRDHDRAEFIRLQCWLSANPESHPEWDGKWQREQALLRKNVAFWSLPYVRAIYWGDEEWDRGFPSFLGVYTPADFARWAEYLANITASNRLVIGWTSTNEDVQALIDCPFTSSITELWTNDEGGGFPEEMLEEFLCSPNVQKLAGIDFGGSQWFSDRDVKLLCNLPILPYLKHLKSSSRLTTKEICKLLGSPHRKRLTSLDLTNCAVDVAALSRQPEIARLQSLELGDSCQTDAELCCLIESPYLEDIQFLGVQGDDNGRPLFSDGARAAFFERFGERGDIGELRYYGGAERDIHRWRMATNRSR